MSSAPKPVALGIMLMLVTGSPCNGMLLTFVSEVALSIVTWPSTSPAATTFPSSLMQRHGTGLSLSFPTFAGLLLVASPSPSISHLVAYDAPRPPDCTASTDLPSGVNTHARHMIFPAPPLLAGMPEGRPVVAGNSQSATPDRASQRRTVASLLALHTLTPAASKATSVIAPRWPLHSTAAVPTLSFGTSTLSSPATFRSDATTSAWFSRAQTRRTPSFPPVASCSPCMAIHSTALSSPFGSSFVGRSAWNSSVSATSSSSAVHPYTITEPPCMPAATRSTAASAAIETHSLSPVSADALGSSLGSPPSFQAQDSDARTTWFFTPLFDEPPPPQYRTCGAPPFDTNRSLKMGEGTWK
mmetsp:Transcript_16642/g.30150  ORF Transcript_16642/g.30150 Transcript_16642/m.30150 type:complete len:357 (+) Transcript_16642:491-1561(+)